MRDRFGARLSEGDHVVMRSWGRRGSVPRTRLIWGHVRVTPEGHWEIVGELDGEVLPLVPSTTRRIGP